MNTMSQKQTNINFIDLQAQQQKIRSNVEQALNKVLDHGKYVSGPEVSELEERLSEFCGAKHVLTCANGTDALTIALQSKNLALNDAVFVPSFTFASTAEVVASLGAKPIFVDINKDDFNMNVNSLVQAIEHVKNQGLKPAAIIAVDLFGLPANYKEISNIAKQHEMWVLADAAQSFGASYYGQSVGTLTELSTTSFFPAKPFGCYGDGGCIFTNDDNLAEIITSIKNHGLGKERNTYVRIGTNSRLDSFQAAVLLEKLKVFPAELKHRQSVANAYGELLHSSVVTPVLDSNLTSAWAQYTLVLPETVSREKVLANLSEKGIPTAVYYATPLHKQPAYLEFAKLSPELPNTDYLSRHVMSLPMDGYISMDKIEYIVSNLNASL